MRLRLPKASGIATDITMLTNITPRMRATRVGGSDRTVRDPRSWGFQAAPNGPGKDQRLGRAFPCQMLKKAMRELGHSKDVDKVEEEFEKADPLRALSIAQQCGMRWGAHRQGLQLGGSLDVLSGRQLSELGGWGAKADAGPIITGGAVTAFG